MRNYPLGLVVAGIIASGLFGCIKPLAIRLIPGFYPLPFTAVTIGIICIALSYVPSLKMEIALASYGAAMSGFALTMAIVIDKACPAGFAGFLSLVCLMSIRYFSTMREAKLGYNRSIIAQMVLLQLGIVLFFIANIWRILGTN